MRNNAFTLLFLVVLLSGLLSACKPVGEGMSGDVSGDKTLCDFSRGSCSSKSGDLTIFLQLVPDFAPSEQPIDVKISADGVITDLTMKLEGRDMFMGVIPVVLNAEADNKFTGQMIFGSCSSGYMVWRATLSFVHNGEQKHLWFDFLADAPKQQQG